MKPLLDHQPEETAFLQRLHFLRQRDVGGGFVDERVAQERRQPAEHRIGALGLLQQHQSRYAVERVEQEMRVELVAQHRQLRAGRLVFQLDQLVVLLFHLDEEIDRVIERRPGNQQRRVEIEHADEQLGEARLAVGPVEADDPGVDEGVQADGLGDALHLARRHFAQVAGGEFGAVDRFDFGDDAAPCRRHRLAVDPHAADGEDIELMDRAALWRTDVDALELIFGRRISLTQFGNFTFSLA